MRIFTLTLIVLIQSYFLSAQVFMGNQLNVGVDEKLGDTIPLNLKFISESGDTMILGDIIDKPTILSFVYFNCPGLCSPLQQGVSEVIDRSDLVLGKDYESITISFDYKDDPSKASEKKKNFAQCVSKDKCEHWYYLTGDSAAINSILQSVGYHIQIAGLDFVHPSGIVVVSPEGKITRYLYGLTFNQFDLKMAIIEAQKGLARPTINKVLEYCFAYEPEGKKYTLQVTKLSATIIIFISLIFLGFLFFKPKKKLNEE